MKLMMQWKKYASLFAIVMLVAQPLWADKSKPVKVADLAWLTGVWRAGLWGGVGEEVWVKNSDNSLMGMFSFTQDGKPGFYEFMTLEQREEGLVLHLRHFHARLIAWEEKNAPLLFPLVNATADEVVFARTDSAGEQEKIGYKLEAPDRLTATLEKVKDGKTTVNTFNFRRAQK